MNPHQAAVELITQRFGATREKRQALRQFKTRQILGLSCGLPEVPIMAAVLVAITAEVWIGRIVR